MFGYKTYDGKSYDGKCSFFDLSDPPLPTGVGWVICVALGCFFAALVSVMVYVSNRNVSASEQTGNNSEVYSTAGRTISAGLTAADVVSKWTWAATLLQSSNVLFAPSASATVVAHASPIPASLPPCSRPRLTQTVSCLSNQP